MLSNFIDNLEMYTTQKLDEEEKRLENLTKKYGKHTLAFARLLRINELFGVSALSRSHFTGNRPCNLASKLEIKARRKYAQTAEDYLSACLNSVNLEKLLPIKKNDDAMQSLITSENILQFLQLIHPDLDRFFYVYETNAGIHIELDCSICSFFEKNWRKKVQFIDKFKNLFFIATGGIFHNFSEQRDIRNKMYLKSNLIYSKQEYSTLIRGILELQLNLEHNIAKKILSFVL